MDRGPAPHGQPGRAPALLRPDTSHADSTFLPIAKFDFAMTIDGVDVIAKITADGPYRTA